MARLDQERQKRLEPTRLEYAKGRLKEMGYEIAFENDNEIHFSHQGNTIRLWPYSGYYNGKGIKPGNGKMRGIKNLLNQLES